MALGTIELFDSIEISLDEYNNWDYRKRYNKPVAERLPYVKTYKWLLRNPVTFEKPIPYKHPSGAIVWVNLPEDFLEGKSEV